MSRLVNLIKPLKTKKFWWMYIGVAALFLFEDSLLVGLARFTDISFVILIGVILFVSLFTTLWSLRGAIDGEES